MKPLEFKLRPFEQYNGAFKYVLPRKVQFYINNQISNCIPGKVALSYMMEHYMGITINSLNRK